MRKAPPQTTLRRLYAVSGNVCSWPTCKHPIFDEEGRYVSELCHIEAAEKGGERYREEMSDDERANFENLLFLCHEHHVATDDVAEWTVAKLKRLKDEHESKFADARLFGQVAKQFLDFTAMNPAKTGGAYERFRTFLRLAEDEEVATWVDEYAARLAKVDRPQRALLCIIVRSLLDGAVTHDELVMKTRSTRDAIATQIDLLSKHKLAWFDYDEYTFNAEVLIEGPFGDTPPISDILRFAESNGESFEAIIEDLDFIRLN